MFVCVVPGDACHAAVKASILHTHASRAKAALAANTVSPLQFKCPTTQTEDTHPPTYLWLFVPAGLPPACDGPVHDVISNKEEGLELFVCVCVGGGAYGKGQRGKERGGGGAAGIRRCLGIVWWARAP